MKKMKTRCAAALGLGAALIGHSESMALDAETELLELLQDKGIISQTDAAEFRHALTESVPQRADDQEHRHSVQSLASRVEKLESAREKVSELAEKIRFSGFAEVELSAARIKDPDGTENSRSDLSLATAELDVDADISDGVLGHVAFLYEDGEDFTVDEGVVSFKGGKDLPVYFNAGKMYIPFGRFESHFISDPATLTLGETNDGALVAGYANDVFDLSAGVFAGAVERIGKGGAVNGLVASAVCTLPTSEHFAVTAGLSYTSNLAASDTLRDDAGGEGVSAPEITGLPGGLGAFVTASFRERFFLDAEYVGAVEEFQAGDLAFDNGSALRPATWNLELACAVSPRLEFAARYGGSDEFGSVAPEDQQGVALLYSPFDSLSFIAEFLHAAFADGGRSDTATVQLAVEF